ncbi:MAG TPA: FecR domain-containing protein [Polyangiaceae bacterium]|jgi:hypothetical protein|nr:FecR domain-containing protein [Polyangiaceae bacterium]
MDEDERDVVLGQMGRLAHDAFSDSVKPGASAAGKRQLRVSLATMKPARRRARWVAVALAALVTFVAVVVYRVVPGRLDYAVEGPAPSTGGYLQGTARGAAVAHFTDGTEVRVGAGARARIVDVDRHGARIALEQGRAHLRVVHLPEAHWSVEAGPFSITVTGTEFDADWSAEGGVLVVEMRTGAVIVRGPLAGDGIGVHGGQRLVASVPDSRLHIEPLATTQATADDATGATARGATAQTGTAPSGNAPATTPRTPDDEHGATANDEHGATANDDNGVDTTNERAAAAEPQSAARARASRNDHGASGDPTHRARSGAKERTGDAKGRASDAKQAVRDDVKDGTGDAERAAAPPSWAKRVAGGDFRGVIADAEGRGLSTTLAEAPLGDLVALADAARYTGSSSMARDALLSQRKRYPTSADAKAAAFLLGRIAEDKGSTGEAVDWYERYLAEAPKGAFAAEALGREMLATRRARGAAAAADVARRYLDRFPGGPYADRARALAAGP